MLQDSNTTPSRNFRPAFLSFQGFIDDAAAARFERALDAVEATSCTYLYLALSSTGGIGRCAARVAALQKPARQGPQQPGLQVRQSCHVPIRAIRRAHRARGQAGQADIRR